jgi:hypothetical protein
VLHYNGRPATGPLPAEWSYAGPRNRGDVRRWRVADGSPEGKRWPGYDRGGGPAGQQAEFGSHSHSTGADL